ncbi:MAG: transcription-repair coupling factor, partial [Moorella sp. (in: Bacteria)]|nr:transcription-repair coupling factor [Moorella sp. (in: firmicutes)]
MRNYGILQIVRDSEQFHSIMKGLGQGVAEQQLYGLPEGLKGLWLAAMLFDYHPILVVTAGGEEAGRLVADLESFCPGEGAGYLPAGELLPVEVYAHSPELAAQRLKALVDMISGRLRLLVAPVDALLQKLPPPDMLSQALLTLEIGQKIDREALLQRLIALGYRRQEVVEAPGQVAARGGIIDIYPLGAEGPVRLELYGDEIDSLRHFDPDTQRSVAETRSVILGPAREVLPPPDLQAGLAALQEE